MNPLFSQNFIRSPRLIKKIINKASIARSDLVVEIGPGTGMLTEEIAQKAGRVIAVEKDKNLARRLQEKFRDKQNIEVIENDFLAWPLPDDKHKIIGNIPFSVTADVIRRITDDPSTDSAYIIMQKEAAEKFAGRPYGKKFTLVSILIATKFVVTVPFVISRREFNPLPKVDAALVVFAKRSTPLVPQNEARNFADFVTYGYTHASWADSSAVNAFNKALTSKQRKCMARDLKIESLKTTDLTPKQWADFYYTYKNQVSPNQESIIYGSANKLAQEQAELPKVHRTRVKPHITTVPNPLSSSSMKVD